MRICYAPLCDEAATVWYKGAWCGGHADAKYGAVVGTLAKLEASRSRTPGAVAPQAAPARRRWVDVPSPAAAVPFFDDPLVAKLDAAGWSELDIEWACIEELGA